MSDMNAIGAASKIPGIGALVGAGYQLFTPPCTKLKDVLVQQKLITPEQRKLLDDGKLSGYPKGDAGIAMKLRDMGIPLEQIADIAKQMGIDPHKIGLVGLQPLAPGEPPSLLQGQFSPATAT